MITFSSLQAVDLSWATEAQQTLTVVTQPSALAETPLELMAGHTLLLVLWQLTPFVEDLEWVPNEALLVLASPASPSSGEALEEVLQGSLGRAPRITLLQAVARRRGMRTVSGGHPSRIT